VTKTVNCTIKGIMLSASIFSWFAAGQVGAHANFKPFPNMPGKDARSYVEGSSAYLELSLSHGCKGADGGHLATTDTAVVFPNAVDLGENTYTEDRDGNRYAGNPVMSIKPSIDNRWHGLMNPSGPVKPFYSHGLREQDVRALHWHGGHVPDDHFALLSFRAQFPKLAGCTQKLRVYFPTVQYCEGGVAMGWIREATAKWPEDLISPGYAPYVDVVRDTSANPLPASCGGSGETIEAYPSAEDIDRYL